MSHKTLLIAIWITATGLLAVGRPNWDSYLKKTESWYQSQEGRRVAENILSWQTPQGDWPKNEETASTRFSGDTAKLDGTFDNNATIGEMRVLAKAWRATGDERCRDAFLKGLDLILKAQYPTGGWPQFYPPSRGYNRHITFNDGVTVRIMNLLKDVAQSPDFEFIGFERRTAAQKAFDRGIECILKCQIRVNGKLTVWCAQHDEIDYRPRPARSYELASLSGGESVGILRLLMDLDDPSPEVVRAVTAGVEWYRSAAIRGLRLERQNGREVAVSDPDAPPLWGRFYEIETNRAIFCNRDGVPHYDYNELGEERSSGYNWLDNWGRDVFEAYEEWEARWHDRVTGKNTLPMVIVGDSTVCEYDEGDVRRGWGHFIQDYFTGDIRVINRARSGRSTKTFIKQGLWKEALADQPAFVLIQFGHNDNHDPNEPESTDAQTDYRDYLRQYIDESRAAGAVPVLITPMHRRKFRDDGTLNDTLGPYADAMKAIAKEKQVGLVDLHTASGKLYLEMGSEGCMTLANAPDDRTHFNEKGARAMAELVMKQLPDAEPSLKPYLKSSQTAGSNED